MKFVSVKAGRIDAQKDGTYKVVYWGREVLKRKPATASAKKGAKRKPKAA